MEAKGTAVMTVPMFIKEKFGDAGLKRWMDVLTPEARAVYSRPVLATEWFPLKSIFAEPTKKLCELFYSGATQGAWELGRFSADHGLKGIYKLFVKFGSAEFIISKASTILPTFYKPSSMDAKQYDKNSGQVRITSFPEPDVFVEARICGWMQQALSISGVKDVTVTTVTSMTKGAPISEFRVTWKDK
jgi:hypothetical protein